MQPGYVPGNVSYITLLNQRSLISNYVEYSGGLIVKRGP